VRRPTIAVATLIATVFLAGSSPAAPQSAGDSWTTFGNGPARTGAATASFDARSLEPSFFLPVAGRITAQVLAAPAAGGGTTLFATTSDGRVYALTGRGYVLWTRDFGQLATDCPQLDGYGITGTGAIDTATRTLYVADAFGRLHALDLDAPPWPGGEVVCAPREERPVLLDRCYELSAARPVEDDR